MKNLMSAILLTILLSQTAYSAEPAIPVDVGQVLRSGVERILRVESGFGSTMLTVDGSSLEVEAEKSEMKAVVRRCRAQMGTEACVQPIDAEIRHFNQTFRIRGLSGSPESNLVLEVLHEMRLNAYGVER